MTSNNTNEYTSEQVNVQVSSPSVSSHQPIEGNTYEEVSPDDNGPIINEEIITKKRRKTSAVWNNFEEIELENGTKKAMCLYCKLKLSTGGKGASISHLKRHSEICLPRYNQDASSTCGHSDFNVEQSTMIDGVQQMDKGMQELLTMVYQSQSIPPTKSELETYLEENIFIPTPSSFCALEWWKDKSAKFKVLSKMAVDILAVPISSVASESTFSAGGRVIDEYRASLNEQSIEALICGGDWLRNKYGLKKNRKLEIVEFGQEEIILKS